MDTYTAIATKRDGGRLTPAQVTTLIERFTSGEVSDAQMAAFAMAVCIHGLVDAELDALVDAMTRSGRQLDWSDLDRPAADKHSTGGVGDKVSLVLAPLAAACGLAVPMLSGRGLGHTGGTLDKLEAIPGLQVDLEVERFRRIVDRVGCAIAGAGPDLAPADARLYALRDHTGTVESVPLIAASIMSKKTAAGIRRLVLDVKVGSGAFMATRARAEELARTMVDIGSRRGVDVVALLTDMDTPLGRTAGNACEVEEAVAVLQGGGPADVTELVVAEVTEMCRLAAVDADVARVLASGAAYERFAVMVASQSGDPEADLPRPDHRVAVPADHEGYVSRLDARTIGLAAWHAGAGRSVPGAPVDPAAGVRWSATVGDPVEEGQPVLVVEGSDADRVQRAAETAAAAVVTAPEPPGERRLVLGRVGG